MQKLFLILLIGLLPSIMWASDFKYKKGVISKSSQFASNKLYERLKHIVLPKVKMEDADLKGVFGFIKSEARKYSKDGKSFNVLYLCNKKTLEETISLDMEDVPVSELIYYISKMAPIQISFEDHAILIKDKNENK